MKWEAYANSARFIKLSSYLIPITGGIALICLLIGSYIGLFASPPDYKQKETVRIMYVHVPAAWTALACYLCMGICSALELVRRHPVAGLFAKASAPAGAVFCFICLATGSLWGKPTWGTWWIWDARLTSMFLLFLLYIGYLSVWFFSENKAKAAKIAGVLCLVGLIDLPIVKFSVEWWNTLHQGPSVFRTGGPSIASAMLTPLLINALGFQMLWICLALTGVRTELNRLKISRIIRDRIANADKKQRLNAETV